MCVTKPPYIYYLCTYVNTRIRIIIVPLRFPATFASLNIRIKVTTTLIRKNFNGERRIFYDIIIVYVFKVQFITRSRLDYKPIEHRYR